MNEDLLEDIYSVKQFDMQQVEGSTTFGNISEKDKFLAAKQILFGLAVLYVLTVLAYLFEPVECDRLIDICTTTFPPLATLILASYFRDKN